MNQKKKTEKDLLKLYCLDHCGTSFFEVSVGNKTIAKNSTDRRLDIVRIEDWTSPEKIDSKLSL